MRRTGRRCGVGGGTWLLPAHCKDVGIAPLMLESDKILSLSLFGTMSCRDLEAGMAACASVPPRQKIVLYGQLSVCVIHSSTSSL